MHTLSEKRDTHSGFTLIEVILIIAVSSILLVALFELYGRYVRMHAYDQAQVNAATGGAVFANDLVQFGLQANAIMSTATVNGTSYTTGATTLVLRLPSIDSTGAVIYGTYDYVVYYQNGTNAYRILSADGTSSRHSITKTLSTTVSAITFTYNNATPSLATKITADITMFSSTGHDSAQFHTTQNVYLRNI